MEQPQQEGKRKRRRNRKKGGANSAAVETPSEEAPSVESSSIEPLVESSPVEPSASPIEPSSPADPSSSSSPSSPYSSSCEPSLEDPSATKAWSSLFPSPAPAPAAPQPAPTAFSKLRPAKTQDLIQFQEQVENTGTLGSVPSCPARKGLINRGNTCFINSIVQAFFSLPSFAKALSTLTTTRIPKASLPVLSIFLKISSMLHPRLKRNNKGKQPNAPIKTTPNTQAANGNPKPTNPTPNPNPNSSPKATKTNPNSKPNPNSKSNPNSKPNPNSSPKVTKTNPNSKPNPNSSPKVTKTNPNSKPKPNPKANSNSKPNPNSNSNQKGKGNANGKEKEGNEWLTEKKEKEGTSSGASGSAWSKKGGGAVGRVVEGECYGGERMDRYVSCLMGREIADVSELFSPLLPAFDPELGNMAKRFNKHEDAHEFLEFLLDKLHDEFVSFEKATSSGSSVASSFLDVQEAGLEVEEWSTMRRKGKGSASVVTLNLVKSPISSSFASQIRHTRINRRGKNTISATTQPYYVLPLDIRFSNSVEQALDSFLSKGSLEGFQNASRREIEVVEKLQIESLPTILVLQLKRFWFNERTGQCEKISHPVSFPPRLAIDRRWYAPNALKPNTPLNYDLVAAVSHHGITAGKGHYTCAARHQGGWVNIDDTNILPTDLHTVSDLSAYLLFYQVSPQKPKA